MNIVLILTGFLGFPAACSHLSAVTVPQRQSSKPCTQSVGSGEEDEKSIANAKSIFYVGFKGEGEINTCCGNTTEEKLYELCFQK